jgi:hypothetical protein
MRGFRWGVAAMLPVSLAVSLVPALPASAHLPSPASLGAVTTVVASHSGTASVALYDDVTLSVASTRNPDTSISGKGRFVGLWLTREDGTGDALSVYRLPTFANGITKTFGSGYPTGQCTPWPNATVPLKWDCTHLPTPKRLLLHQGYYRLTVLTDGSPLRVTLHLHGANGHRTVHPTTTMRTVEAALPQRDGVGDKMVTFGAAQSGFDTNAALMEFASVKIPANSSAWGEAACDRFDDGSTPPPLAYGPACPGGIGGGGAYYLKVGPAYREEGMWVWGSSSSNPRSGKLAQGGAFWSDQGVRLGQTLGVWIAGPCDCWAF